MQRAIKNALANTWPKSLLKQVRDETAILAKFTQSRIRNGARYSGKTDLRLNIGCGPNIAPDYVNVDIFSHPQVLYWDCRKSLPFDDNSVQLIFAEHIFEHFEYKAQTSGFLSECHRCLQPSGVLRIIVPDAGLYVSLYQSPFDDFIPIRPLIKREDHYGDGCLNAIYKTKMEFINSVFRQDQEHKYAYDFETLELHLREFPFQTVQRQQYQKTLSQFLPLDTLSRSKESLYVEAVK